MADLEIRPVTPERWGDLVELFGTRGDPSWCWCQFFLTSGNGYRDSAQHNRAALEEQVRTAAVAPGLIAYAAHGAVQGESLASDSAERQADPVGWVQLGPRTRFPRVCENRSMAAVADDLDDESVWAVTCFVVKVGQRRRGVAGELLAAAVDFAREHGASALVGHPVDVSARPGRVPGADLYHGVASTFAAAGFAELGRTAAHRPVVRLDL